MSYIKPLACAHPPRVHDGAETPSTIKLKQASTITEIRTQGITTKSWTTQEGQTRIGGRIDKKYLHKLLRNRIYLGELSLKGTWYPGAHPAIVDHGLWGQVHEVLAKDPHARAVETRIRSRSDALLRGLLYTTTGDRMCPTFTTKNGRTYRYYMFKAEMRFGAASKTNERIPAEEVEAATVAQIKTVLASPESIASVCAFIKKNGAQVDEASAVMTMHRLSDVWEKLYPAERHRIVNLMIERVDLVQGGLKVRWRELGWKDLIGEFARDGIGAELVEMEAIA